MSKERIEHGWQAGITHTETGKAADSTELARQALIDCRLWRDYSRTPEAVDDQLGVWLVTLPIDQANLARVNGGTWVGTEWTIDVEVP